MFVFQSKCKLALAIKGFVADINSITLTMASELQLHEIINTNYSTFRVLRHGRFGAIVSVQRHHDSGTRCLKFWDTSACRKPDDIILRVKNLCDERYRHPNVIEYYNVEHGFRNDRVDGCPWNLKEVGRIHTLAFIEMELLQNSLRCVIQERNDFIYNRESGTWQEAAKRFHVDFDQCLLQIAQGLKFLHDNSVVHNKLTPNNIMHDSSFTWKICDYGLWELELKEGYRSREDEIDYIHYSDYSRWDLGSRRFKSDETHADVYSFGLIIFDFCFPMKYLELINAHKIFRGKGKFPSGRMCYPEEFKGLIMNMIAVKELRPCIDEVIVFLKTAFKVD